MLFLLWQNRKEHQKQILASFQNTDFEHWAMRKSLMGEQGQWFLWKRVVDTWQLNVYFYLRTRYAFVLCFRSFDKWSGIPLIYNEKANHFTILLPILWDFIFTYEKFCPFWFWSDDLFVHIFCWICMQAHMVSIWHCYRK